MASTRERGQAVEARVAGFLEEQGLRIVDRNVTARLTHTTCCP